MINWNVKKDDLATIALIVKRAKTIHEVTNPCALMMDIQAVHCNGNPLRLKELLAADDANFGHDVFGIQRYVDRHTGKLTNCFSPRYSA